MNRKSIVTAIAISAAAFAASAESYEEYNKPFVSTSSRAVVQQDVAQRGGVNPWSTSYNPIAHFRSDKSRAQVTADYIAQRDVVDAFTGEDSGSGYLAGRPAAAGETRIAARR